ncbi:FAS1-like dehydratase domain-containing protein [Petropleomorpha daqingensis]|uniref:3-methylfumaryl-CoA hydratase n=1 Tax=Petropleomorpha daqingensis TaxID=2026353 RepID=A0A853CRF3_9ACTN|nr:MaoC family dehydratase N-terminal domain-containing protein [Petropleomorpha daqingensis]NYJ08738.1 3-methylfumaryl-CoA hydratase [Petropleomorpha daqingensis]
MTLADAVADWHPAPVERTDRIAPWPVAAFAALLDSPAPEELPPLWHWFSFLEAPAQSALAEDGHPADGHFLPPIPDRRRMIAGGRAQFSAPLRIGSDVVRRSRVAAVRPTSGRSGEMVFVTVRHRFECDGELAVVEEQDVVYRSQPAGSPRTTTAEAADQPETGGDWRLQLDPDARMLFRFSALTYNTHRIHYDQQYVTAVEGYPGLVVHGPLLALLLLELPRRSAPDRAVAGFEYRLRRPCFAGRPVVADGVPDDDGARLSAGNPGAPAAVTGRIRWGPNANS